MNQTKLDELVRRKVKCCFCGGSMQNSHYVNVILLTKLAEWENPCWGNFLIGVSGLASAILCDKCKKEGKKPKYALEWSKDLSTIKYHPVENLKDIPEEIVQLLQPVAG